MRSKLVATYSSSVTNDVQSVGAEVPFVPSAEVVLCISPTDDAVGTITIETDDSVDSSGSGVYRTVVNAQSISNGKTTFITTVLGDNLRVTTSGLTAGSVDVYLLGE